MEITHNNREKQRLCQPRPCQGAFEYAATGRMQWVLHELENHLLQNAISYRQKLLDWQSLTMYIEHHSVKPFPPNPQEFSTIVANLVNDGIQFAQTTPCHVLRLARRRCPLNLRRTSVFRHVTREDYVQNVTPRPLPVHSPWSE